MKHPKDQINEAFDCIKVPQNLDTLLERAIRQEKRRMRMVRVFKYASSVAAVFVITAVALLNLNPVFAKAVQDVPVLGDLCRIFTFRQYGFEDEVRLSM